MDPISELKTRAEILHRRIQTGDLTAIRRLRALPEFRRAADEGLVSATIQRTHCLAVIAAELGFANWPQAKSALTKTQKGKIWLEQIRPLMVLVDCERSHLSYEVSLASSLLSLVLPRRQLVVSLPF